MTSLELLLRLENREFREQLGGAMETATRIRDKVCDIRNRLDEYIRVRGYAEDELLEIFQDLDRLCGRKREPDTNHVKDSNDS